MTAPDPWCPGAHRTPADVVGVPLQGGEPRVTWHCTEGGSIKGAIAAYRQHKSWPTITWDPLTGEIHQHFPATVGARALQNDAGGVQTNAHGRVHIQIEVVGHAASPFTAGPMKGLATLLRWIRSHGVPDTWPGGQPLAYGPDKRRPGVSPAAYGDRNGTRSTKTWAKAGHFGHSQVPENDHGDPGAIDITFTTKYRPAPAPTPAPAPAPTRKAFRLIVRFRSKPDEFEVVGSHLEHITAEAFNARGLKATEIVVLADDHALAKLERR